MESRLKGETTQLSRMEAVCPCQRKAEAPPGGKQDWPFPLSGSAGRFADEARTTPAKSSINGGGASADVVAWKLYHVEGAGPGRRGRIGRGSGPGRQKKWTACAGER